MRKRFEVQLELGQPAIEEVVLPKRSRDELPPLLKGLQWIFKTPELNEAIFELLENAVVGSKQSTTGRASGHGPVAHSGTGDRAVGIEL